MRRAFTARLRKGTGFVVFGVAANRILVLVDARTLFVVADPAGCASPNHLVV